MYVIKLDPELQDAIDSGIQNCTDKWGRSYLESVKDILEDYGLNALEDQLIYARSNMQTWKGDEARRVKEILSNHIKILHDMKVERQIIRRRKQHERRTTQKTIQ